ncbi:HPF/RaiA family ribosome-associated protein [Arenibaculum pallidiluteum]|uniref:HPF/RaiA family ribosome-associated protein n=1 Tax=Arenibaculum pallidiluteum TaxID=2812559 RepID=UPI001A95A5A3|nr:HPF/RaiA family ribosome-associated protein [Arenibaculum pallidiluteum]
MNLDISFHNLDPSEAVKERVREGASKLQALFPRLTGCQVVLEGLHQLNDHVHGHRVRIRMTVPGQELVVSKEPDGGHNGPAGENDMYHLLHKAFDAAQRRLRDFKETH